AVERAKRRRAALRALVAAVAAASVWGFFWSPLFSVRGVKVVGGDHTTAAEIAAAAGIDSEDNVLLVSTGEIASRARSLPWVKSADVDRMLPGTIRVRITERRPSLVLSCQTGEWTLDKEGRVLATGAARRDLPVLAGVGVEAVRPGMFLRTREAKAALRVYAHLPRPVRREVVAIFAPTLERITLLLRDHMLVRYGAPENLAAKNNLVGVLRARLRARGAAATYIDVRVPSTPAIGGERPAR
ncbi:MAG: cell division protein FtsQ/DivIB, partial [Actinomycetota bacterium]